MLFHANGSIMGTSQLQKQKLPIVCKVLGAKRVDTYFRYLTTQSKKGNERAAETSPRQCRSHIDQHSRSEVIFAGLRTS